MRLIDLLQDSAFGHKPILEKLLCHICSLTKEQLFAQPEREITPEHVDQIRKAYHAYTVDQQPLEYILGTVTFADLDFSVTPATLIPRPETEYMIEAVREYLATVTKPHYLLDIGTGCGVLGLSVYYHHPDKFDQVVLTEYSSDALQVAQQNALTHQLTDQIELIEADLLDHPLISSLLTTQQPGILVANLPYIPEEMFNTNVDQGVKRREPKMAFVGGDDGLDLYRKMLDQLGAIRPDPTTPPGQLTLFLEMMTRQMHILQQDYASTFTFREVKTFHFNIRIVQASFH
jgi:release factor glutamine methyltransferase